ncbi:winged helix-turn-helix transcriptional regulator [Nocardia caishijiensis]|uniref:HxlR family transcriptional regulator n=1 Tax=Nocardia caishijiensis TaxID=184756 RepID=A0ABQ6YMX9_9NOCA|nr:helix-turn-helix domain-containing protein [Nocardia caishijiensis]KAF0847120.1 HxlR family transcriptional regulator [Nocardia caishijiensis]
MRSAIGGDETAEPSVKIVAAIDLLGQRWMLRVIWELEPGPLGFLDLRRRMGNCSSSMLSDRLQQLQSAGLTRKNGPRGAYELTTEGALLAESLQQVWDWAEQWTPTGDGNGRIPWRPTR